MSLMNLGAQAAVRDQPPLDARISIPPPHGHRRTFYRVVLELVCSAPLPEATDMGSRAPGRV